MKIFLDGGITDATSHRVSLISACGETKMGKALVLISDSSRSRLSSSRRAR
jgi:hypothetical protein